MLYNAKCPKCGTEQKGLDLKETDGSAECYKCGTKFKVTKEDLINQTKHNKVARTYLNV